MLRNKNGQLFFCYSCSIKPKNKNNRQIYISLLIFFAGIFLLPNLAYFSDITPKRIIDLTNEERLNNGLSDVSENQLLTQAAYNKGNDILINQKFQHTIDNKKFSSWIKESGYTYSYVGENLAIDFVTSEGAMKAWLKSLTHKKNILNEYFKEIGVAVIEGKFKGNNTVLIVQIFGSPYEKNTLLASQNNNYQNNLLINNYNFIDSQKAENLLTHSYLPIASSREIFNQQRGAEAGYNDLFYKTNDFKKISVMLSSFNKKFTEIKWDNYFNYRFIINYLAIIIFILFLITILQQKPIRNKT